MNELLEAEVGLEERRGVPYCPCQGTTRNWAEDMTIVCPCIPFHKEHFDVMKRCWCGLYVHKDVVDPSVLRQISFERDRGEGSCTLRRPR